MTPNKSPRMPAFLSDQALCLDTRAELWVFLPPRVPRRVQLSTAPVQHWAESPTEPDSIKARKPSLGASQLEDHAQSQADVLKLNLDRLFTLCVVHFQQLNVSSITAESLVMPRQRYIFLCSSKCSSVLWCLSPHPVTWPRVGATK